MNYARFLEWSGEQVEKLVEFGVPRKEAESIFHYVEIAAVNAETHARSEAQFLIEFKELGSEVMGERRGVSGQAIRRKRAKLLRNSQPPVALQVAG